MNQERNSPSRVNLDVIAPLAPNAWLRYEAIRQAIPAGVSSVLEIGCGCGALGARLAQRYTYLGVEPDEGSWLVARDRMRTAGRGEVRNVTWQELGDRQFDLVCAFEVLEHIEDDAAAAKDWVGHVRPGGWLMLSVPADQDRYGPWDKLVGHFRRYGPDDLTEMLEGCGLTDIAVRRYGFPLGQVLEYGRNFVGRRRLGSASDSVAERTAASGRTFQPNGGLFGLVNRCGTAPFRMVQRRFPGKGTALLAIARVR